MASVASEGVAGADRRVVAPRLRAAVLGPRGGGTTRRRASDAFRLGFAVVVVVVSVPVMRANSAAELRVVHALNPPPAAIRWLVTSVFWLGSAGVIVVLVILGLLVPRLAAVRWTAVAAVITWGVCLLLGVILGPSAGRPVTGSLAGLDTGFPVTEFAVTMAVAATVLPYLSRPLHRLVSLLVALASIAAVIDGSALPVNTISSLALGWGVAAGLHLAVGSPLGPPSAGEITGWIATLLVVITLASIIGGAIPVPGGMGVVEAGLIGGLTSAGIPQDQAVAAVFIQRLFTAYLPPIWGWMTLAWMRRREYV